jgi:hypothetical protein
MRETCDGASRQQRLELAGGSGEMSAPARFLAYWWLTDARRRTTAERTRAAQTLLLEHWPQHASPLPERCRDISQQCRAVEYLLAFRS